MVRVEVEIISKELVKPSSPTPDHIRHHQLSFLDQVQTRVFVPFIFFYSKESSISSLQICKKAKKSLSEVLTIFYPLAGRVKDNTFIECNDEGVLLVEAKTNCQLSDILRNPNAENNDKLFPFRRDKATDLAAFSQITFFEFGGLAISFSMSHKLDDAVSLSMFLNSWAALTLANHTSMPRFGLTTVFPPSNLFGVEFGRLPPPVKDTTVTKWFSFDASVIAALKAKYTDIDCSPLSVEALSAFIWTRFMAATRVNQTDANNNKLYPVFNVVNLRSRMKPPLDMYFGNIVSVATAVAQNVEGLVRRMRESVKNAITFQKGDEDAYLFLKESKKWDKEGMFLFTSLCKFPAYQLDFGWGKPVWVASPSLVFKNQAAFVDNKGGGIEAWISLKEEDMAKFEIDKEILAHVSSSTPFLFQNFKFNARSSL